MSAERKLLAAAVAAAVVGFPGALHASGFQLVEQNASGLGNAYAGQGAAAQDASTVFWNPAGMTKLQGLNIVGALNAIRPSTKFENTASTPAAFQTLGGAGGDAGDWAFVPNAYLSWQLSPRWFAGVGINVPFGLKTDYDQGWMGRFYALKSELKTINVNPSVAFKVNDQVSLGFGLNWQRAEAELTNAVNWNAVGLSIPGAFGGPFVFPAGTEGVARVEGDDSAWGWNAGAMFTIGQNTRIGITYRSAMDFTLDGTAAFSNRPAALAPFVPNGSITADVKLPATAAWNIFVPLNSRWDLMADITWTEWSSLQALNIVRTNGVTLNTLLLNWRDTFRAGLGANYHVNNAWTLRFGTAYDQTPTKDEFRTPRIPDGDRFWLAFGAQYRISKQLAVDFGYAHLFVDDPSINLTPPNISASTAAANGRLVGNVNADVNILSVQVRASF